MGKPRCYNTSCFCLLFLFFFVSPRLHGRLLTAKASRIRRKRQQKKGMDSAVPEGRIRLMYSGNEPSRFESLAEALRKVGTIVRLCSMCTITLLAVGAAEVWANRLWKGAKRVLVREYLFGYA